MESRYHDKECAICGKVFTPMTANQRYCSPDCREVSRKNMAKEYTKIFWDEVKAENEKMRRGRKKKKPVSIDEIMRMAKEQGMTYGQFVAEQYKKGNSI